MSRPMHPWRPAFAPWAAIMYGPWALASSLPIIRVSVAGNFDRDCVKFKIDTKKEEMTFMNEFYWMCYVMIWIRSQALFLLLWTFSVWKAELNTKNTKCERTFLAPTVLALAGSTPHASPKFSSLSKSLDPLFFARSFHGYKLALFGW